MDLNIKRNQLINHRFEIPGLLYNIEIYELNYNLFEYYFIGSNS